MSETKGLYAKYIITKADGTPVNDRCFILKPDKDPAAAKALQAYAAATDDEQLRNDLYAWVGKPVNKPLTLDVVNEYVKDAYAAPLWFEYRDHSITSDWWKSIGFLVAFLHLPDEVYGKTWRCWASKPTDEERRAAEWMS